MACWNLSTTMLLLAASFFCLEFKPSDPYLTNYLVDLGFSELDVSNDLYPTFTYSLFCFLLPFGFLVELIGYRKVLYFGIGCRLLNRILLIWSHGIHHKIYFYVVRLGEHATCSNYGWC